MIDAKHRRLANHAGDLDLPFMRILAKFPAWNRKLALMREIRRLGWEVRKVPKEFTRKFWLRSITLNRTVLLGSRWSKSSVPQQCRVLAHELVHIRQRKRMGQAKFLLRYAVAPWRWAMEASAYRANRLFVGEDPTARAKWLYYFYKLGRMRKKEVVRETVRVLDRVEVL